MPKLNQIVAVVKGLSGRTETGITKIYKDLQKPQLFTGLSRTYTPRDDAGEKQPPESTRVQKTVPDELDNMAAALTELFDVVYTKERGNQRAEANVTVDDQVIARNVPVSYLLFLEKHLVHWRTALNHTPVLPAEEEWTVDTTNSNWFRTPPVETLRTKKVPRNHVKAEATDRHPAQVELYYEDVPVGTWATTKFSGAIPAKRRDEMLARIEKLIDAVKTAREEANSIDVEQERIGADIFTYLLQ